MDSTRQIIRWSLPGLIFALNFLIVHGTWIAFTEHRSPVRALADGGSTTLVAVIAGGLPLGFLIYQIYFHGYTPVGDLLPRYLLGGRRIRLFYRRDRGGEILKRYLEHYGGKQQIIEWVDSTASNPGPFESRQDIQWKKSKKLFLRPVKHFCGSSKTTEAYRCPKCEDIYEGYFYQNWVLLQSMIDYCSGHESRRWIKTEYTSGSDLYHGLGAARVACGLGWATAVAYDLIIRPFIHPDTPWIIKVVSDMGWGGLVFWPLVIGFLLFELMALSNCRIHVLNTYEERMAASLAFVSKDLNPWTR